MTKKLECKIEASSSSHRQVVILNMLSIALHEFIRYMTGACSTMHKLQRNGVLSWHEMEMRKIKGGIWEERD